MSYNQTPIKITEHTTTDDTYCQVENLDTGEVGQWLGTADDFIDEVMSKKTALRLVELVLS